MGLDMYLKREVYVGAKYNHLKVEGEVNLTSNGNPIKVNPKKISTITEDAGYWRKANQIHKWFVDNVQNGKDDCGSYYVPYKKLLELKELCEEVLKTRDATKLPPCEGFFFGSNEIDEGYFQDLTETVEIINSLDQDSDYYYQASW